MELIDTHCHIQSIGTTSGERNTRDKWQKAGITDPDEIISNAKKSDVNKLIVVGCDLNDSDLAVKFVDSRPNTWASVGIHPHEAKDYVRHKSNLKQMDQLIQKDKVVSIGECGLDYYYLHSNRTDQKEIFTYQLDLAVKYNKPVIFHVREAFSDFWTILEKYKNIKGVIHSFSDNHTNLTKALDQGLYIGVNGIATFTKVPTQRDVYKNVPLSSLMLETDSPFLTPHPYRGTINQPKMIRVIAEYLADLRQENLDDISLNTSKNAKELFGI